MDIPSLNYQTIESHLHDGNLSQRVDFTDLFGYTEPLNVISVTVATTGNTDAYFIAPRTMNLYEVDFSTSNGLTADNTNYITFSLLNLGQDGASSTQMLAATDANTTKATGGTSIVADSKRTLTLSTTLPSLSVIQGDRIRIRAAATGTLAGTLTFPVYLLLFN